MSFCLPTKGFHRQQAPKLNPNDEPVVRISVYGKGSSKIAMLWTPEDNLDNNIVSEKVAKRLGVGVEQDEKEVSSVDFMGQTFATTGYVLLKWGIEGSRQTHTTRFLVVATTEDPFFEVVVGRRHAIELGLV